MFHEIEELISNGIDGYYTLGIEELIKKNKEVGYQFTNGLSWIDMDEAEEFQAAKKMFDGRRNSI